MSHAATDENGRTAAAMSRPSRPFLTVDLSSRTIDFRPALRAMGALARIGKLADQCLVHKTTINRCVEYTGR